MYNDNVIIYIYFSFNQEIMYNLRSSINAK